MLDYAASDAQVFLNGDDDKLITLKEKTNAFTFGLDPSHPIWADQLTNLGLDGIRCQMHFPDNRSMEVTIPLPGTHMVYNAMAGASVGLALGLTLDEIKAGIEALKPLKGRSNIFHTGRYTLMDDCYNASPSAMIGSLDVLDLAITRKVAILGDMGELGETQEALHASVGEHLKDLKIDLLITIGSLSNAIHEAARTHAPQTACLHFPDKAAFFKDADSILKEGDSILIKASHAQGFEEIVEELKKRN
jgi:UDP-N-acetylmuramoyl-tripeptide--D-alanyl-D-alanine ligase